MKKSNLGILNAAFLLLIATSAVASVKLPAIISSNMVLQRNTTIALWGWADAKEKISIETSWSDEPIKVQADKDGTWRIEIKTTQSKEPQSIRISSPDSDLQLKNILFGEVWLCSGQSNMQQPVKGFSGQPSFGTLETLARAENPNLRLFTVDRAGAKEPKTDVERYTPWQEASPENAASFSAVAYYFGQQLQEILDVPVGLIHTSWGGSTVEAWMSQEAITNYQQVDLDTVDISSRTNRVPTALYNAMIHPLIPYTIQGALWYQGEANRNRPNAYKDLFPAMVRDWRNRWNLGDFPFYYVQIAPFWYNNREVFSGVGNSAYIREAQLQCLDLIPNSGIAITMDIGDEYSIHPPRKKEVADRLLYNALSQTYQFPLPDPSGPVFDSLEIKDDAMVLYFKNASNGLYATDGLNDFEIAGPDKVFYPADATIINRKNVRVTSPMVPNPVAVRYAWRNWLTGTLFNTNLLPASSFRTDTWNDATRKDD